MKSFDKETIAKEFGAFIREAREKRGLYQSSVAEHLCVSRAYYTHIEAGNRDIYFATAVNICSILGLNINDFVKRLK